MNIYLVVEGFLEKKVYPKWIEFINPEYKVVDEIDAVVTNHLYVVSGGGYPSYFDVIEGGVYDVAENKTFDRLVIAVDSEDMSYDQKKQEIEEFINGIDIDIEYQIVVQHFCIETWALGNRNIVPRHTAGERVRNYRDIWDVLFNDPEELPALDDNHNRAQFAKSYLRALLNAKFRNLSYSERNPKVLLHPKYFKRVRSRYLETGHIASFNDFLTAFV